MNFGFGTRKNPMPLPFREDRPRWKQVHGTSVVEITAPAQECGEVDALWTRLNDYPIGIVTADCVPLLLARQDGAAVAAIHSGWRGTEARILEAFFQALPPELSNPRDWTVRIGPAIHACCYEVSEELIARFETTFREISRSVIEPAPRKLDLIAVNQAICEKIGLPIESVHADCTLCAKESDGAFRYFSYRRGDRQSRQYSMIFS